MENGASLIDQEYFLKTGQPGHGLIEIPTSDDEEDGTTVSGRGAYGKLDKRNKAEKLMFYFVWEENLEGMREVMRRYPNEIRVNAKDDKGWTMLMWAVNGGNVDMVGAVLREVNPGWIEVSGGLSKAVELNEMECLKAILLFAEERKFGGGKKGRMKAEKSMAKLEEKGWPEDDVLEHEGEFGVEVTPLMMASLKENRKMMEVLWRRGERMPKFHYPSCKCRMCRGFGGRDIERSIKRVKLLEALVGREWLFFGVGRLAVCYPEWEAMKVRRMIDRCIEEEPEYAKELEDVRWKVDQILQDIVSACWTEHEVRVLLEGKWGRRKRALRFLRETAEGKMRRLLCHPSIQWYLEKEWKDGGKLGFYGRFAAYKVYLMLMIGVGLGGGSTASGELDTITYWLRWTLAFFWIGHLVSLAGCFVRNIHFWKSSWNRIRAVILIFLFITFYEWFWEEIIVFSRPSYERRRSIQNQPDEDSSSPSWITVLGHYTYSGAIFLSVLGLLQFTLLVPILGPIQACLWVVNEGKWKPIALYLLLTIILLFSLACRFSNVVWWQFGGFTALLMASSLIITFLQCAGTGLFCNDRNKCGKGSNEWQYRRAVEMIRQRDHGSDFPPPLNLLPCSLFRKADEDRDSYGGEEWDILVVKLYRRCLRKEAENKNKS